MEDGGGGSVVVEYLHHPPLKRVLVIAFGVLIHGWMRLLNLFPGQRQPT